MAISNQNSMAIANACFLPSSTSFLKCAIVRRFINDCIKKIFNTDVTVSNEMKKTDSRVRGFSDVTSNAKSQIDMPDKSPAIPITDRKLLLVNTFSQMSLGIWLLLSNISFTRNWPQLLIIVVAAIPIVIQLLVSIWLLAWAYCHRQKNNKNEVAK